MTRLDSLLYSTALVASVWFGCEAYKDERAAHEKAETVRAEHYAKTAEWNASAARFEAIKAHVELEAKRTTVETNIKSVVIAELKKCKRSGCK